MKNLPGRAKTNTLDSIWLAKVAERGMCAPSLVHPPGIRRWRDLTRYRRAVVGECSREMQRAEKLLEDAQIKISAVLSDVHGVSGRQMMEALVAGRRGHLPVHRGFSGQRKALPRRMTRAGLWTTTAPRRGSSA